MRLQTQLFAVMAVLFTLVLGSIGTLTYRTQSQELRALVFDRYFMVTNTLTIWVPEYIKQGNWAQMDRKTIGSLSKIPDVVYAFIADENGEIIASFDETMLENFEVTLISMEMKPKQILEHRTLHRMVAAIPVSYTIQENTLLEDSFFNDELRGKRGDKVFDLHQKLYYGKSYVGYIRIGFSEQLLIDKQNSLRNSILLACLLLLFFSLCISLFVARRFTRALRRFTREVSRVRSDTGQPLLEQLKQLKQLKLRGLRSNTYEIQQLSDAFQEMNQYLISDITKHEETEQKLKQSNSDLKMAQAQLIQSAKLASLGELATSIAHELKQPLTIITMSASEGGEFLAYEEYDEIHEVLESITRSANRGAEIVDRMRIFGRESSQDKHTLCDMNDCVHNVMILMKKQLKQQNVVINLELEPELPSVLCDSVQIEQVLTNLIGNARDAMETSDAKKITIRSKYTQTHVSLEVKDSGGGIPERILPHIFESFYTTKESGKGTGLGLSISKGIIKSHGGIISVQTKIKLGTSFKIELPIHNRQ